MEKNIKKAIEKEKEYLNYRRQDKEPFHFADAIKQFGFNSLTEYFKAKAFYEVQHLSYNILETTPEKAIEDIQLCIKQKVPTILFNITPFTLVWNGFNSSYNEDYCKEHHIPVFPLYTAGGTIVSTKGDLNIGICIPSNTFINKNYFLQGIANILQNFTNEKVTIDNNDILINNKKVLGSSCYDYNGMFVFIAPISLSEKTELINSICVKKSSKIPSFINFLDATTLYKEIKKWITLK